MLGHLCWEPPQYLAEMHFATARGQLTRSQE